LKFCRKKRGKIIYNLCRFIWDKN